jgi:hypothetical protein
LKVVLRLFAVEQRETYSQWKEKGRVEIGSKAPQMKTGAFGATPMKTSGVVGKAQTAKRASG